jgi:hypothetical protein
MIVTRPTAKALEAWHSTIFNATESFVRKEIGDEMVDSLIDALDAYRK